MTNVKDVIDLALKSSNHLEDCILCKTKTKQRGIWETKEAGLMGARPDKRRYFVYAICQKHPLNEETAVLVENTISTMMRQP